MFFSILRSFSLLLFSGGAWLAPLSLSPDFRFFVRYHFRTSGAYWTRKVGTLRKKWFFFYFGPVIKNEWWGFSQIIITFTNTLVKGQHGEICHIAITRLCLSFGGNHQGLQAALCKYQMLEIITSPPVTNHHNGSGENWLAMFVFLKSFQALRYHREYDHTNRGIHMRDVNNISLSNYPDCLVIWQRTLKRA